MWSDDPSTRVYITVATAVAEGQVKERHENITWQFVNKLEMVHHHFTQNLVMVIRKMIQVN